MNIGDTYNYIYLIKKGVIAQLDSDLEEINKFKEGDHFGDFEIITNYQSKYILKCTSNAICFVISKCSLVKCFGDNYHRLILYSLYKHALSNNSFFKNLLLESDIESVFHLFKITKYNRNDIVYSENKFKNKLLKIIIVLDGGLIESKFKKPLAEKGVLFGDILIKDKL